MSTKNIKLENLIAKKDGKEVLCVGINFNISYNQYLDLVKDLSEEEKSLLVANPNEPNNTIIIIDGTYSNYLIFMDTLNLVLELTLEETNLVCELYRKGLYRLSTVADVFKSSAEQIKLNSWIYHIEKYVYGDTKKNEFSLEELSVALDEKVKENYPEYMIGEIVEEYVQNKKEDKVNKMFEVVNTLLNLDSIGCEYGEIKYSRGTAYSNVIPEVENLLIAVHQETIDFLLNILNTYVRMLKKNLEYPSASLEKNEDIEDFFEILLDILDTSFVSIDCSEGGFSENTLDNLLDIIYILQSDKEVFDVPESFKVAEESLELSYAQLDFSTLMQLDTHTTPDYDFNKVFSEYLLALNSLIFNVDISKINEEIPEFLLEKLKVLKRFQ